MTTYISPDQIIIDTHGGYHWTSRNAAKAWNRAWELFGEAVAELAPKIEDGYQASLLFGCGPSHTGKTTALKSLMTHKDYDIVFDATLLTPRDRAPITRIPLGVGFTHIHCAWAESVPISTALDRRMMRLALGDPKSQAITPDVIKRQFDSFKPPLCALEGITKALRF